MKNKIIGLKKLIRFDKPIGTFLLMWPTLSTFFVITKGNPSLKLVVIFCIGAFLMRSAGCIINDYFDRNIDGSVKRTSSRPLVTGEISPHEALLFFTLLIILSSTLLLWTNKLTFIMAFIGLLITCLYPLTKRFFFMPQIFLGFAFSWGVIMVSSAELNTISIASLIIFSSCFLWILAYDSEYAMSDMEDDALIGIHSSALTLGKYVKVMIIICHLSSLLLWFCVGYLTNIGSLFYVSLLVVSILIFYQYLLIKDYDREKCFQAFRNNNWVGMVIFIGAVLGTL